MMDRVGQRLGNYRLVRKIGQGGFAEVYLGQHIYLDTFAAIKVLHARLESDDVEYFLTEARTVARLLHPNIVRVLEFNVELLFWSWIMLPMAPCANFMPGVFLCLTMP